MFNLHELGAILDPTPPPVASAQRREWTLKDVPLAVRLAFDPGKLGIAALGLMAACLAYGTFHWLGALTGERGAHRAFAVLGAILATCICVLFSGLIAKMATAQLLESRRAGAAELRKFIRAKWTTLLGLPLAFGGFVLLLLGIEALLALLGAIPGVGPIVFAASFLLAFTLSLIAVLTIVVHTVGAFLYPTIVATQGVGSVGAILEVVELARRKPLHILLYQMVVTAVGALMTLFLGFLVWTSVNLTILSASAIMRDKFDRTMAGIPRFFDVFLRPFSDILRVSVEKVEVPWHYDVSGALLGGSLLVVVVLTLVYPFVFFTSAGSITYLILRPLPEPAARSPIEDL